MKSITRLAALILALCCISLAQVRFVPVPEFPASADELQTFRDMVFMPRNIGAFASPQVVGGTIPASGATAKPWRDNATVWQPERNNFEYIVCCDRSIELKKRSRQSDAGTITVDVEGIGLLEGLYSMQAVRFYNERVLAGDTNFSRVPLPTRVVVARDEAGRLNIANQPQPVPVLWPIAIPTGDAQIPTTINPDVAFRFGPGGRVEAFSVTAYDRTYPIVIGNGISDQELVDSVAAVLASGMPIDKQASAIRRLAR